MFEKNLEEYKKAIELKDKQLSNVKKIYYRVLKKLRRCCKQK